ncbi:MAG: N-acetylmuramoyl-L-alanine amidase [Caldilineaceae bacterium]|nr:N-acetylmuramoyl-L-alanine amidase [Caldilineaceae bacterium]
MPRPLIDSPYLYGIHEPGGESYLTDPAAQTTEAAQLAEPKEGAKEANGRGWVLFTEAIGHDPTDRRGIDFTTFSQQGLGIICRLNHGYEPEGTIPHSSQYENFARRVANFVAVSRGCKIWIIGNEMNYAVERPGIQIDWSRHNSRRDGPPEMADPLRHGLAVRFTVQPEHSAEIRTTRAAIVNPGEAITPERYARCYQLCREAIHRLPGHGDDQVLVGAVAPWNTQTIYEGNANGDWIQYFRDILTLLGPKNCDGFTLHSYTHGPDPALITDETLLPPPFQNYHRHFRAYRDFMAAVPPLMRQLPVYLTETDQTTPWLNENTGWVQRAYAEIDAWNRQGRLEGLPESMRGVTRQQIRALILYRWPRIDKWHIEGKTGVITDFQQAIEQGYRWQGSAETPVVAKAEPASAPRARVEPAQAEAVNYWVAWLDDQFPEQLVAGETVTATLTLRNAGLLTWRWGGGNPFRLGYHYYRNRRRLPMPADRDLRTDIPQDVGPGETITLSVRIALPVDPGNYTLELDLVQEGVTWFKEQKSPVLTRWLTVEAPLPAASAEGEAEVLLPVPLFTDLSTQLPRRAPYARRSMSQIRSIVISHTAAHPNLSLERIAQTHLQHGYPGIVYQFVVTRSGEIFRVSQLEEVAQPDQVWSEQGVNVCLTGNFRTEAPPLPQLEATGRLCAWLAHNLGLSPDMIQGLGELLRTDSPGDTFYRGPTWKQVVIHQVRLHLAALLAVPAVEEDQQFHLLQQNAATLTTQNSDLQVSLKQAETEQTKLQDANTRLQAELAAVRRQLQAQAELADSRLYIQNLIYELPRDLQRYMPRPPDRVQHIVINHTGVDSTVPWREISDVHRAEWPGILYDFGINAKGQIFQFQPLDEVVETNQGYLVHAINIAFAGEFHEGIPTDEQLYAGGQLIAWLIERFPRLSLESVKGLREFIDHSSPGEQWLDGRAWKHQLLAAVRRASGEVNPLVIENTLRVRISELEVELDSLQQRHTALERQKARIESENHRLQGELQEKLQINKNYVVPKPSMRVVIDQLPRHPNLRYERRSVSQISHLAIHHTAAPTSLGPLRIAEMHVAPDGGRGKEAWPGIGYHYFIHADGTIEQTNQLETICYHVYRHNSYTVGIVFAGSFMNGRIPTAAQLRSGAHLVAWLMQELHLPLARVWGHREFPENTTVCPGSEWTLGNRWRDLLFERIEQVQTGIGVKNLRHYLLLGQQGWQDVGGYTFPDLLAYIERFQPTVGFSLEDAKYAEYVTLIGGEAAISAANEAILVKHGCKIDRVAGRDPQETIRLVKELVRLNRRFQSYDIDFE